jgi:hypothetical protein
MKAFRYNCQNRESRKFNMTGREKNPNNISFYASNMTYVDNYKYVRNEDGDIIEECQLEVVEIAADVRLFDMAKNFKELATYNSYIASEIGAQMRDYTRFYNEAKNVSDRKLWARQIEQLKQRESELISILISSEFQPLSDFEFQNQLVAELRALGFDGYFTVNEVAIF